MNKIISDLIEDFFYDDGHSSFNELNYSARGLGFSVFSFVAMYTLGPILFYLTTAYSGHMLVKKRLRYLNVEMNNWHMVLSVIPFFRFWYMIYLGFPLKKGHNLCLTKHNIIEISNKFKFVDKWEGSLTLSDKTNNVNVDFNVINHFYSNNDENKCLYFVYYKALNGSLRNKPNKGHNEFFKQIGNTIWKCRKAIYEPENYNFSAFRSYDKKYVIDKDERVLCYQMSRILDNGNMIMYIHEEIVKSTDLVDFDNFDAMNFIKFISQGD